MQKILSRLRNYLTTGIIAMLPLAITLWVLWQVFSFVDRTAKGLLGSALANVPGVGVVLFVAVVLLAGIGARSFIGKRVKLFGTKIITRIPLANKIYEAVEQISTAFMNSKRSVFKTVALLEYPRKGIYTLALITKEAGARVNEKTGEQCEGVFILTTPNPTTGLFLYVPRKDLIYLSTSIEDSLKQVISAGLIVPPYKPAGSTEPNEPSPENLAEPMEAAYAKAYKLFPMVRSALGRLREYFVTGIAVLAPSVLTVWVLWKLLAFIDGLGKRLLGGIHAAVPGIGIVVFVAVIILAGALTTNLVGKRLVLYIEGMISRIPLANRIYEAVNQISQAFLGAKGSMFSSVVLVEYPREGVYSVGFVTSAGKGEVQSKLIRPFASVFVPTTPNPTSGFLIFVPEEKLARLDIAPEDGLKLVISGGIYTPDE